MTFEPLPLPFHFNAEKVDQVWRVPYQERAAEAALWTRKYQIEPATNDRERTVFWPYHAMIGGIGHALVSAVEEAVFFHSLVRTTQPDFQVKGQYPLTENYSVPRPEVVEDAHGHPIGQINRKLIQNLLQVNRVKSTDPIDRWPPIH